MAYARKLVVLLPMLALAGVPVHGAETLPIAAEWDRCVTYSAETGEAEIDPVCFFEKLIARYRCLEAYEDIARVIQITQRSGEKPLRVETLIGCEIQDGRLLVETPASQIRRTAGLDMHFRQSPAMEAAELSYKMWLAPHMALRFTDEPERDFRPGVREGFTPTEAESVTVGEKPMVHLQLESGDGRSEPGEARFDLYVNPASMLIERITGSERLSDGANYETTLEITPISSQNADARPEHPDKARMVPPEPGEAPATPGRAVDPSPRRLPDQAGTGAAPPTTSDPLVDRPPAEAPDAKPPPAAPPGGQPGSRSEELGKPGDAKLKPPGKADETSAPPDTAESGKRRSTEDDDAAPPPKRERTPPGSSSPPPGNTMDFVGR